MNEYLKPLDSSQLEVFLGIFWEFFIFLNSNLNFKFGPVSYRTKPEPVRSGLTGNRSNRTGYRRFGEPCSTPPILETKQRYVALVDQHYYLRTCATESDMIPKSSHNLGDLA